MSYDIRTDGSPSTGPEGVYLVWYSAYGNLNAASCPDLQEALEMYASLYADEFSMTCIDGPAGVVDVRLVNHWHEAEREREREEWLSDHQSREGEVSYLIEVRAPDGYRGFWESAQLGRRDDLSDAITFMGELNRPGRVRITRAVVGEASRVIVDWSHEQEQAA